MYPQIYETLAFGARPPVLPESVEFPNTETSAVNSRGTAIQLN
jgi:hypothetical protein